MSEHISAIFGTNEFPPVPRKPSKAIKLDGIESNSESDILFFKPSKNFQNPAGNTPSSCTITKTCDVDVQFLNKFYGITSNLADSSLSQAVFETGAAYDSTSKTYIPESFSQSDLRKFQTHYGLTIQNATEKNINATVGNGCTFDFCGEGSLDIQYIMGIAQQAQSIFWYEDPNVVFEPFLQFLIDVYNMKNPPSVLSISWGSDETDYFIYGNYAYLIDQFNIEAMKLGAMGITILVSSGDKGVSGNACGCLADSSSNPYFWNSTTTWSG